MSLVGAIPSCRTNRSGPRAQCSDHKPDDDSYRSRAIGSRTDSTSPFPMTHVSFR